MHFLLLNQFFAPDQAPTGQLLADVARALVAEGHSVRVVCSRVTYEPVDPVGQHCLEQADIRRVGGLSFGRNRASRVASYAAFFLGALRYSVFGRRPDVILTLTTPPLLSLTGTLATLLRGARHVIWEMDVYPDVAVALGEFSPGGLLDRAVGALADFSRHRAASIIAIGPCMQQRLASRGISLANITIAENWVDGSTISPRPFPVAGPVTLLYSGNLGHAHDSATIGEAMSQLTDPLHFRFVFAGGGSGRKALEASCRARNALNAEFLPYQDPASFANRLGRCHLGLVTQKPETCGAVVPSKTYALMAAGRPFIFIGPAAATPARLIARFQCGWHVDPGDASGLVAMLELLAANPGRIQSAGQRARQAFLAHCDLPAGVSRIVRVLANAQSGNLAVQPASIVD